MTHVIAFNLFFACCLIYCLRYGGAPERAAILAQAVAAMLTIAIIAFFPHAASFTSLAEALVLVDSVLLASLIVIALKANRLWTIALAGLQLSTVLVHLSKALVPALPASSYAIFAQFWAWPMLITTAWGTHSHRVRVKKEGQEQDWKPIWPRLAHESYTT